MGVVVVVVEVGVNDMEEVMGLRCVIVVVCYVWVVVAAFDVSGVGADVVVIRFASSCGVLEVGLAVVVVVFGVVGVAIFVERGVWCGSTFSTKHLPAMKYFVLVVRCTVGQSEFDAGCCGDEDSADGDDADRDVVGTDDDDYGDDDDDDDDGDDDGDDDDGLAAVLLFEPHTKACHRPSVFISVTAFVASLGVVKYTKPNPFDFVA